MPISTSSNAGPSESLRAAVAALSGLADLRRAKSALAARLMEPHTYLGLKENLGTGAITDVTTWEAALRAELAIHGSPPLVPLAPELARHAVDVMRFIDMTGPLPQPLDEDDPRRALRRSIGSIDPIAPPPIRPIDAPASPIPTADVWIQGARVRYFDTADRADLPLLLIHGHSSSLEEHTVLLPGLLGHRRLVACDLPGSGWSEHPARSYELRYYEDILLGLMAALDIERFAVVGGSMGGNLALRLALRAPERVRTCVAWAPAQWIDPSPKMAAIEAVDENTVWPVLQRQARAWYPEDDPEYEMKIGAALGARREVFSPGFLESYRSIGAEQVRTTLKGRGPDIRVPVKLLVGEDDTDLGMVDGVKELHGLIPGSQLVVLPGKHALAEQHPERMAEEILSHVALAPG